MYRRNHRSPCAHRERQQCEDNDSDFHSDLQNGSEHGHDRDGPMTGRAERLPINRHPGLARKRLYWKAHHSCRPGDGRQRKQHEQHQLHGTRPYETHAPERSPHSDFLWAFERCPHGSAQRVARRHHTVSDHSSVAPSRFRLHPLSQPMPAHIGVVIFCAAHVQNGHQLSLDPRHDRPRLTLEGLR
jgi:hypothetical protein